MNTLKKSYEYYIVSFGYAGPKCGPCPGTDDSLALSKVELYMEGLYALAKERGIDLKHAYSWPDGSLYKWARSTLPYREVHKILHEIFDSVKFIQSTISVRNGITPPLVGVLSVTPERSGHLLTGDYITIEELFTYSREKLWEISSIRRREREAFYHDYRQARDACPTCLPGMMGCDSCHSFCRKAEQLIKIWEAKPRILERVT